MRNHFFLEYGSTLSEMRDSYVLMSRANLLNRFCSNETLSLVMEKSLTFKTKFSSISIHFPRSKLFLFREKSNSFNFAMNERLQKTALTFSYSLTS